jgi:hypothetical protein
MPHAACRVAPQTPQGRGEPGPLRDARLAGLRTHGLGLLRPTYPSPPGPLDQCIERGRFQLPLRGSAGFTPGFPIKSGGQFHLPGHQCDGRYADLGRSSTQDVGCQGRRHSLGRSRRSVHACRERRCVVCNQAARKRASDELPTSKEGSPTDTGLPEPGAPLKMRDTYQSTGLGLQGLVGKGATVSHPLRQKQ